MIKALTKVLQQRKSINYGKTFIHVCHLQARENTTHHDVLVGVNKIPRSDAMLMTNKTSPIVRDPGYYIVVLDVFHQLHCLVSTARRSLKFTWFQTNVLFKNMMRKRFYWNESLPVPDTLSTIHIDHCIDMLRQSVMCSSDVTPIPYAWYPKYQEVLPMTGIMHTCRDFDAVRDWARERQTFKFNATDHVEEVVHLLPED
jgi:hypothetical protein